MRRLLALLVLLAAGVCLGATADWATKSQVKELQKRVRELEKNVYLMKWKLKKEGILNAGQARKGAKNNGDTKADIKHLQQYNVYKISRGVPLFENWQQPKTKKGLSSAIGTKHAVPGASYIVVYERRVSPRNGWIWYKVYAFHSPSGADGEKIQPPQGPAYWMPPDDAESFRGWLRAEALYGQELDLVGSRRP